MLTHSLFKSKPNFFSIGSNNFLKNLTNQLDKTIKIVQNKIKRMPDYVGFNSIRNCTSMLKTLFKLKRLPLGLGLRETPESQQAKSSTNVIKF